MPGGFEDNDTLKLIQAIGAMGEMTLVFYRTVINAGATQEEAFNLVRAFIAATITACGKSE